MAIPKPVKVDENLVSTNLQNTLYPSLVGIANTAAGMTNAYQNAFPTAQNAYANNQVANQANYQQIQAANQQTAQQIAPNAFTPAAPQSKAASIKAFYQNYIDKMNNAKSKDEIKAINAAFKPNFDLAGLSAQDSAEIKLMQGALNKAATTNVSRVAAGKPPVAPASSGTQNIPSGMNAAPAVNKTPALSKTPQAATAKYKSTAADWIKPEANAEQKALMDAVTAQYRKENGTSNANPMANNYGQGNAPGTLQYKGMRAPGMAGTEQPVSPVMNTGSIVQPPAGQGEQYTMTDANGKVTTGNASDFGNYGSGTGQRPNMPGYLWQNNVNTTTGEPSIGFPTAGTAVGHNPTDQGFAASGYTQDANGNWSNGQLTFDSNTNQYVPAGTAVGQPKPTGTGGTNTGTGAVNPGYDVTGGTGGNTGINASNAPANGVPQNYRTNQDFDKPVTMFDYAGATQLARPGEEDQLMKVNKELLKNNPAIDTINTSMQQSQNALNNLKDYSADAFKAGQQTGAETDTSNYLANQMKVQEDAKTNELIRQMQSQTGKTADEQYAMDLMRQRSQMGTDGAFQKALYESAADPLRRESARLQESNAADLAARGLGASTIVNDVNSGVQRDLTSNLTDLSNKSAVEAERMRQDIINNSVNQMLTGNQNLGTRATANLANAGSLRQSDLNRVAETGLQAAQQQGALQNALGTRGINAAQTAGKLGMDYTDTQLAGAKNQAGLAVAKMGVNQQIMDNIQDLVDKQQGRDLTNINLGTSQWDKKNAIKWDLMNMPRNLYSEQNPLMQANAGLTSSAYQAQLMSEAQKNANKSNLWGTIGGALLSKFA